VRIYVWAWRCELCGHTWMAEGVIDPPEKCKSCHRTKWHKRIASLPEMMDELKIKELKIGNL
jgi:rubredoxin